MSLSLDLRWAVEKGDGPEVERLLVEGVSVHESFMVRPLSHHHCEERVDQNRVVVCVRCVSHFTGSDFIDNGWIFSSTDGLHCIGQRGKVTMGWWKCLSRPALTQSA